MADLLRYDRHAMNSCIFFLAGTRLKVEINWVDDIIKKKRLHGAHNPDIINGKILTYGR
jgi:hypothetical protein